MTRSTYTCWWLTMRTDRSFSVHNHVNNQHYNTSMDQNKHIDGKGMSINNGMESRVVEMTLAPMTWMTDQKNLPPNQIQIRFLTAYSTQ